MSIINRFLDFNKDCPVCEEPLTLYMQCSDKTLWKSSKRGNTYTFNPYKLVSLPFTNDDVAKLTIVDKNTIDFTFSNDCDYKPWQFNLFLLCNQSGFEINGAYNFDINPYKGCYFRATPWMEYKPLADDKWDITVVNPNHNDIPFTDECFCFKTISPELTEKVYIVNLDYEMDKTKLWHYSADAKQREDIYYFPNMFEKEMPMLSIRPQFNKQDKFIERLDNWILMS